VVVYLALGGPTKTLAVTLEYPHSERPLEPHLSRLAIESHWPRRTVSGNVQFHR
jgi:hypothetical protein